MNIKHKPSEHNCSFNVSVWFSFGYFYTFKGIYFLEPLEHSKKIFLKIVSWESRLFTVCNLWICPLVEVIMNFQFVCEATVPVKDHSKSVFPQLIEYGGLNE